MGGPDKIALTQEIHSFLIHLAGLIREWLNSNEKDRDFQYWDKSYALKEDYRNKVSFGIGGKETDIETSELVSILDDAVVKIDAGLMKARNEDIYIGYFINEVAEYDQKEGHIVPRKFTQNRLCRFWNRRCTRCGWHPRQKMLLPYTGAQEKANSLTESSRCIRLRAVFLACLKKSADAVHLPLAGLRMNQSGCTWNINTFWRYSRTACMKSFYEDFKNTLIPFQKPAVYGRSILEIHHFGVERTFRIRNSTATVLLPGCRVLLSNSCKCG